MSVSRWASPRLRVRLVSTLAAIQRAPVLVAIRFDARMSIADVGLGPMHTSSVSEILQVCRRSPEARRAVSR